MKAKLVDLASAIAVLALAIALPVLAGADLESRGYRIDDARPAILA